MTDLLFFSSVLVCHGFGRWLSPLCSCRFLRALSYDVVKFIVYQFRVILFLILDDGIRATDLRSLASLLCLSCLLWKKCFTSLFTLLDVFSLAVLMSVDSRSISNGSFRNLRMILLSINVGRTVIHFTFIVQAIIEWFW